MPVCFTFDVEPHDRIEAAAGLSCPPDLRRAYARSMDACTRWLLDTLGEFDAKATFFVVGQVAVTHSRLIRDMAEAGHEVACHSWDHRRVHHFTPATFRRDVRRAKNTLEQTAGQAVVGYRAPTFSIGRETAWAIDVLADEGFRYDSSVFPVRHDRYGVPDAPRFPFHIRGQEHSLLELPPATLGLRGFNLPAAGGGYFRLFPPMIMRTAVRQAEKNPNGVPVLYFHPWEFDPGQPRLPLGRVSRFRTYVGIKWSRGRLRDLVMRYESRPMIDAAEELSLRVLPTFRLGTPVEVAARAAA
jgi:polysaccharide deacetylase family protein (PEP-CTERM system associated)